MYKKVIKEVGEASAYSFPFERKETGFHFTVSKRDEYDYRFKTDEGYEYSIILERLVGWGSSTPKEVEADIEWFEKSEESSVLKLKELGIEGEDVIDMWSLNFSINSWTNPETGEITKEPWLQKYYYTPSKGEFFKIMSTLTKIVREHMQLVEGKVLIFTPQNEKRSRVFLHYITKQVPSVKYFRERDTFYFVF